MKRIQLKYLSTVCETSNQFQSDNTKRLLSENGPHIAVGTKDNVSWEDLPWGSSNLGGYNSLRF